MMLMINQGERFYQKKWMNSRRKILLFPIICGKCSNEDKKILKEEESIEILKIFDLKSL